MTGLAGRLDLRGFGGLTAMTDATTVQPLYDTYNRAALRFERGEGSGLLPKPVNATLTSLPALP